MIEISEIAQALAVFAACWAIISGIDAWKREFIGKRKIELAEEVLAAYFEVKDAIAIIRNPWSRKDEGSSREKLQNESAEETELLNRGYTVFERYETRKEEFLKFRTLKYRFMAVFGAENEAIFSETDRLLNSIFVAANMLSTHYWKRQGRVEMDGDEFKRHLDEMNKHEKVLWDHQNDTDEIRVKLNQIQVDLEKVTKDCFEESTKTYGIFTRRWFQD